MTTIKRILLVVLGLSLGLAIAEGVFLLGLLIPNRRWPLQQYVRHIYMESFRRIIQYDPSCSRLDEELLYILRPGTCRFSNREFDVEFKINSLGLRDDEKSLAQPEIIALGDSMTMGWGVDQEDVYPQIIERRTGLLTLNAGISSYATARELMLLKRLDVSRLRYLIIQYSPTDFNENKVFYEQGRLVFHGDAEYQSQIRNYHALRRYFPGKYSWMALRMALRGEPRLPAFIKELLASLDWAAPLHAQYAKPPDIAALSSDPIEQEAILFLHALGRIKASLPADARIIVFKDGDDGRFASILKKRMGLSPPLDLKNSLYPLSVPFDQSCYYVLDDHPNALGHKAMADSLCAFLPCRSAR